MYFLKSIGLSIRRALYIAHYVKKKTFLKCNKGVVIKSTELKLQLVLLNFYGIKRHTGRELEPPLLSSQVHISLPFIFIMEKRLLFRS